ncbi:MAG TPA: hypothetical protein VGM54_17335 [Chthoniobacter sp.]
MLPLILAFLPSAFFLILVAMEKAGIKVAIYCLIAAVLGLACCIASSVMLFRRNTPLAIVFGVLFALLNLVISGFLGCASLLADNKFH